MRFLFNDKHLDKAEKIQLIISYILQLILLIAGVIGLVQRNWVVAFSSFGILILTFLPAIIRRNYKIHLPVEFDLITIIFIFAAIFLGEVHGYYTRFWWWDVVLHTSSGFLLGIGGFILVYILNEEKRVSIHMKPGFIALFAFAFAVMLGAVWEIFEFSMDQTFGLRMQASGLIDTMWDLIVDTIGAFIIALLGYAYVKSQEGKSWLFERVVKRFVRRNPHLFRKRNLGR